MSTVEVRNDTSRETRVNHEDEAVVVTGADVHRSKEFYARRGWGLDDDFVFDDGFGVVPLKPPDSGCSVHFGTDMTSAAPTSADRLYLIVSDVTSARSELVAWRTDVSGEFHRDPGAQFQPDRASGRASDPALYHASYGCFPTFSDSDGDGWLRREMATRLPGRMETEGALQRAAVAHGTHEARTGEIDPDRAELYVAYRGPEQAWTRLPS